MNSQSKKLMATPGIVQLLLVAMSEGKQSTYIKWKNLENLREQTPFQKTVMHS